MTNNKPLNFYMAGKIRKGDWRIVFQDNRTYGDDYDQIAWQVSLKTINGYHNYTGPYFASCDHGCAHNGLGLHATSSCNTMLEPTIKFHGQEEPNSGFYEWRGRVFGVCQVAILRSDIVIAYIDAHDCYGTIAEIGYAYGKGKQIYIFGPEMYDDMWFVYQMSTHGFIQSHKPAEDIASFIYDKFPEKEMDYHSYIRSQEWRDKAEQAKKRAGYRCQLCNKSTEETQLHAHHRTYERLFNEKIEDITVLCAECHAKFHNKKNGLKNSY